MTPEGDELALLVRHYKENKKKCTLQPLRQDPRFRFQTWQPGDSIQAKTCLLLETEAPELTIADAGPRLLLLDSTWRFLPKMRESIVGEIIPRSLPKATKTAYPRKAILSDEPSGSLASIEALYLALRILGTREDELLAAYHWREEFLTELDSSL